MSSVMYAVLLAGVFLIISGCDNDRVQEFESQTFRLSSRIDELESNLDDVRSQLSEAESELAHLKGAANDLNDAVDEFGYIDWTAVVPNVQSASGEVMRAARRVESSLEDIASAVY